MATGDRFPWNTIKELINEGLLRKPVSVSSCTGIARSTVGFFRRYEVIKENVASARDRIPTRAPSFLVHAIKRSGVFQKTTRRNTLNTPILIELQATRILLFLITLSQISVRLILS